MFNHALRSKKVIDTIERLVNTKGERPRGHCTHTLTKAKSEISFLLDEIARLENRIVCADKELDRRVSRFAAMAADDFANGKLESREFLVATSIATGMRMFLRGRALEWGAKPVVGAAISAADELARRINSASPIECVQEKPIDVTTLESINSLNLRIPTYNALIAHGISSLGDILNCGLPGLLRLKSLRGGLRPRNVDEVVAALAKRGFALYGDRFVMVDQLRCKPCPEGVEV